MKFGSMFSGIEAASVAWKPLGWECQWVCEIEPFPCSVLAHHYPDVPNLGNVMKVNWDEIRATRPVDVMVFGSPCQSFSVAGKRLGLDDPRGNLALYSLSVVKRLRPRWFVFENVPGLLSSDGGRDFGRFLAAVGECGYQCAWRVLDAQYFGVAQRRRRVFVVGYLGDWRRAAAVLFERHSLQGHPAPSRQAGKDVAAGIVGGIDYEGNGHDCDLPTGPLLKGSPTGGGHALPAIATFDRQSSGEYGTASVASTVSARDYKCASDLIAFNLRGREGGAQAEIDSDVLANIRAASGGSSRTYIAQSAVRRLTPVECERLQGFPDNYTNVPHRGKPAADGPRYKALGNSMAVPVMAWLGQRIKAVEGLQQSTKQAA